MKILPNIGTDSSQSVLSWLMLSFKFFNLGDSLQIIEEKADVEILQITLVSFMKK